MVGTHFTGDGLNAPPYGNCSLSSFRYGTQDGTSCAFASGDFRQTVTLKESHPHPITPSRSGSPLYTGLCPRNPSRVAAARTKWPPHDVLRDSSNVRSLIPNCTASPARLLICEG